MGPNWDERYGSEDYAYGKAPNAFFKEWLPKFEPGRILMPADGEGRNGVYAAKQGWHVTSFDLSKEGKAKALKLADDKSVKLAYEVGDLKDLTFENESFDAIGLVYAHFPAHVKSEYHQKLSEYLKPGGVIIFEAYSKAHLPYRERNPEVGGPNNIDMLFSTDDILQDFENYEVIVCREEEVKLKEGKYHNGKGSVIRFVGRKSQTVF